jgi:hypothetical protein
MTASFFRCVSRLLILTVFLLPFQPIQAAMVPTDQVVAAQQDIADRDKVRMFLGRADIVAQLQALGVSQDDAQARIDALTDEEVKNIAGNLDSLPAGGDGGWVAVLLIILVAYLVYVYIWKRR